MSQVSNLGRAKLRARKYMYLIEIRHHCLITLFSRYSFAKSWRLAGERYFAFAVVVPAYFADRPDRSWILAYRAVLSGLLIVIARHTMLYQI